MHDTYCMPRFPRTASVLLVVLFGWLHVAPAQALGVHSLTHGRYGQTLKVSQAKNLAPTGAWVTVTGAGYDERIGIYVSMCLRPKSGKLPTPCGGGVNQSGSSGASVWVSSHAPSYGAGLAKPFGIGGTFRVRLFIGPRIGKLDCRKVSCVITTRADHLQTSNRTADVFIPVTFSK